MVALSKNNKMNAAVKLCEPNQRLTFFLGGWPGWLSLLFVTMAMAPSLLAEETNTKTSSVSSVNFPIQSQPPEKAPAFPDFGKFDFNTEVRGSSAMAASESESFEITRRISNLMDLNLFAGYYEFDEGPEDDYSAMKAGMDVAITNKIHFEASFFRDHELDESSGFIGLWGAIPLGERKPEEAEERGAVRSLWSAMTPSSFSRMRTRKEHPSDNGAPNQYETIEVASPDSAKEDDERSNVISRVWKNVRQDRGEEPKSEPDAKREGRLSRLLGKIRR